MKKLIFLFSLVILTMALNAQSFKIWSGTYNTQYGDTVLRYTGKDVTGCIWSASFSYADCSDDSTFSVDFGGSEILLPQYAPDNLYHFTPLNLDSLPYAIDSTIIGDTIKTMWTSEPFPFRQFQMDLDVKPLDSANIDFVINFNRQ